MTIFEDPRDTTGVFRYFPVYNFKPDTDTLEKLKGRGCRFIFADLKLSLGVEDARNLARDIQTIIDQANENQHLGPRELTLIEKLFDVEDYSYLRVA